MQYIIAVLHQIVPQPGETLDQAATRTQLEIVERGGVTLASSRAIIAHVEVDHDEELAVYVGTHPRRRALLEASDLELAAVPTPLRRYRLLDRTIGSRVHLVGDVIEARDGRDAWEKAQNLGLTKIGLGRDYSIVLEIEEGK